MPALDQLSAIKNSPRRLLVTGRGSIRKAMPWLISCLTSRSKKSQAPTD
jgi:hypothetical protein